MRRLLLVIIFVAGNATGAVFAAHLAPTPVVASGQESPAEVSNLETEDEPTPTATPKPKARTGNGNAAQTADRDRAGFSGNRAITLVVFDDGDWTADVPSDDLIGVLDADGPLAAVEAALAKADE